MKLQRTMSKQIWVIKVWNTQSKKWNLVPGTDCSSSAMASIFLSSCERTGLGLYRIFWQRR